MAERVRVFSYLKTIDLVVSMGSGRFDWIHPALLCAILTSGLAKATVTTVDYVHVTPPTPTATSDVQIVVSFTPYGTLSIGTHSHTIASGSIVVNLTQDGSSGLGRPHDYFTEDLGALPAGTYDVTVNVHPINANSAPYAIHFQIAVTQVADPSVVEAVEYYNSSLDHYFMTSIAEEKNILDSGQIAGWQRTGQRFDVNTGPIDGTAPVCRYYIPPALGDSHFFSVLPSECGFLFNHVAYQDESTFAYVLESEAVFNVAIPSNTGVCPDGRMPLYRLWNQRADSNHRYTTDRSIRAQMITEGYVPEGLGPDGVGMCVLP